MPHPLAQFLDFANHHANAIPADIEKLCASVIEHGFHAAFVNPAYITLAKKALNGKAPVGTVINFPLGQDTIAIKVSAVNEAVRLGADELDVVPNIGTFLSGQTDNFAQELSAIVDGARMIGKPVIVKFIVEPGYLNETQLADVAMFVAKSGADYVKIGSGMGPRNPTVEDFRIVKKAVPDMKIKVAGGITSYDIAKSFVDAGVTRIGTSHALEIITGTPTKNNSSATE